MDWLTWFLITVVFIFLGFYIKESLNHLFTYKQAKDHVVLINGTVESCVDEMKKSYNGEIISISYPLYKYEVDGKEKYLQSTVQYQNMVIGKEVPIYYCCQTKKAWAKNDLPLIKRQLFLRVSMVIFMTTVMVLVSVFL